MDLRLSQVRTMVKVYCRSQELYVRKKPRFMMPRKNSKLILRRNRFQLERDHRVASKSAYLTDIKRSKSLHKLWTKRLHQHSNPCKQKLKPLLTTVQSLANLPVLSKQYLRKLKKRQSLKPWSTLFLATKWKPRIFIDRRFSRLRILKASQLV